MRSTVALLSILVLMVSRAEAVIGEVRDSEVHHETAVEAWVHAEDPHGAHAHDDDHPTGESQDGTVQDTGDESRHEHGGSSDHCTHVHSAAVVDSMEWAALACETSLDFFITPSASGTVLDAHSPPPRA